MSWLTSNYEQNLNEYPSGELCDHWLIFLNYYRSEESYQRESDKFFVCES